MMIPFFHACVQEPCYESSDVKIRFKFYAVDSLGNIHDTTIASALITVYDTITLASISSKSTIEMFVQEGINMVPFKMRTSKTFYYDCQYEEAYIGEGKREKVHHINGKIPFDKLTSTARSEVEFVVKELVHNDQKPFIEFFNKAQPLTTRMHQLELLPGLGKKHMWEIINEREEKDFESFADIKARVKLLPDPEKAIIKRILLEIEGQEKYRLFTQ